MTPPADRPASGPSAEHLGFGRRVGHLLLIAAGWLLFAWSWRRVTAAAPEVGELRWLLATAVLVVPVLTIGWVAHNVGIHRRKGPRRSVTSVAPQHRVDFNGRRIVAAWPSLLSARQIDIVVDGDCKRFIAEAVPLRRPKPVPAPHADAGATESA